MALIDIVVDTNVLIHATNGKKFQEHSINLLTYLLSSTESICVDEGFCWDNSNKSLLGSEYLKHLKNGMLGYSFIVSILSSKRFKECSRNVDAHISKKINQCISNKKPRDKTFVKVAINSSSKTLVSHDYEDFKKDKRKYIKSEFGVNIVDANEL